MIPIDAIKSISAAEEDARQAKAAAVLSARAAVEAAEKAGKEAVASSVDRAETEIARLKRAADQQAADKAIELASTTANRQAALRARAEGRLEKAAQFIVERIVNV